MKHFLLYMLLISISPMAIAQTPPSGPTIYITLSVDQKSYMFAQLSDIVGKMGLKFNTDNKDAIISTFGALMGEEITPSNVQALLDRYKTNVESTVVNSDKKDKLIGFLRDIASQFQTSKDIEYPEFDAAAKKQSLKPSPELPTDVTMTQTSRIDGLEGAAKEVGKDSNLYQVNEREFKAKNNKQEIVTLPNEKGRDRIVGNDLWFGMLVSNEVNR